jgi:malate permease and related proteins
VLLHAMPSSPIALFIVVQLSVIGPFAAGLLLRGRFSEPLKISRSLVRINLAVFEPLIVVWCVWGLEVQARLLVLPCAGFGLAMLCLGCGWLLAPLTGLTGRSRQTFLISSTLSNHGFTLGGFVCFMLLGEAGLGYAIFLVLYFMPYVFGIIFPAARLACQRSDAARTRLRDLVVAPQNLPLAALFVALLLSISGIPRPDVAMPITPLLLISVGLYYFTLGVTFSGADIFRSIRPHMCLGLIKFIIVPVCALALLRLSGLDPLMQSVIFIQACMSTAIYSVIIALMFDLDERLASALFVVNTVLCLICVIPLLFWLIPA